jgi:hypothetical protein
MIANVALSNTFNEFRTTTNEVIGEVNKLTDGTAVLSIDSITANTFVGVVTDLDVAGDTGNTIITLGSEVLTIAGGTGLSSSVSGNTVTVNLDNTTVAANTYGSASQVPVITVDAQGRISNAYSVSVAGVSDYDYYAANSTFVILTADGGSYSASLGQDIGTSANVTFNKVTVSNAPSSNSDLANKAYVDEVAQGLKAAPAVEVATTANLTATYDNGTAGVGSTLTATSNGAFPTIDGVTVSSTATGQNGILVKNQSTAAQNGRYNLTQVGDGSTPWILTRCGVCDEASEIPGSYVFVKAGTTQASTGWVAYVVDPATYTVGTDSITYFQFSGVGTYTAGAGLTLNGTEFSLTTDTSNATNITSGTLAVARGGTGATSLAANNVILGNGTSEVQVVSPGTSSNVLTSNGTTWVSAPGAGVVQAVASGTLANGDKVVINADGTVSVVSSVQAGAASVFTSLTRDVNSNSVGYDQTNDKVVVAYIGSSFYLYAVVGTVTAGAITFGTPVVISSTDSGFSISQLVFNSTGSKVVIQWVVNEEGKAVVGTVSGTSISFGDTATWGGIGVEDRSSSVISTYDSSADRVITFFTTLSGLGRCVVGTVSGTSISYGSPVSFQVGMGVGRNYSCAFDSTNNKVVVAYRDNSNSSFGTAKVGTVSGTSISFGTAVVFNNAVSNPSSMAFDSVNSKIVISYHSGNTSPSPMNAIVGTVSGTSISFGTPAFVVNSQTGDEDVATVFDTVNSVIRVLTTNSSGALGVATGTVSGTSISFGAITLLGAGSSYGLQSVYDPDTAQVIVMSRGDSNNGIVFPVSFTPNLTAENFIGISNAAYANGATATIQTVGSVDDAQSGLTAGQAYYVQTDGTLSTTPGTPNVFAGTAISDTKLVIATIPNIASANGASTIVARDAAGNFSANTITVTDLNSTSDRRLKTNVKVIVDAISVINNLDGVTFDWIKGGSSYGFIAQDVEKVLEHAVHTDSEGIKSVNYSAVIPYLVESIKVLEARIQDLEKTK